MEDFDNDWAQHMTHPESEVLQWKGYFPGVLGYITALHGVYFYENWGFDISFEVQVGKEVSEFITHFKEKRDELWVVSSGDTLAGCAVIDASQSVLQGARLRWFIVAPQFQGCGLGHALLDRAVEFCRKTGCHRIYLWTFKGLDRARSLFEGAGFKLCEEVETHQWGRDLVAQKYELDIERNNEG